MEFNLSSVIKEIKHILIRLHFDDLIIVDGYSNPVSYKGYHVFDNVITNQYANACY